MYPIEELEDEAVSASQQTLNMAKPPVMDSTSVSISSSSSIRKPPELMPTSVSPSSSSSSSNSNSSVMGKVERPAIKIYATLMVPHYVYIPLLVGTLQSS